MRRVIILPPASSPWAPEAVLGAVKGPLLDEKGPVFRLCHGTQGETGRSNAHKKGAAREARGAFLENVGPSNFAFVCCGTGEKLDL